MKINGKETTIVPYASEKLDDEMVLYCEESHKIIVLNQTAVIVWNEILECCHNKKDICTKDITNVLMKFCNLPESENDTVSNDVDETIDLLYKSSFLISTAEL